MRTNTASCRRCRESFWDEITSSIKLVGKRRHTHCGARGKRPKTWRECRDISTAPPARVLILRLGTRSSTAFLSRRRCCSYLFFFSLIIEREAGKKTRNAIDGSCTRSEGDARRKNTHAHVNIHIHIRIYNNVISFSFLRNDDDDGRVPLILKAAWDSCSRVVYTRSYTVASCARVQCDWWYPRDAPAGQQRAAAASSVMIITRCRRLVYMYTTIISPFISSDRLFFTFLPKTLLCAARTRCNLLPP